MVTMPTPPSTAEPTLVGVAEISGLLHVPRSTVSMWDSRRATNNFPEPVEDLAMGPVYRWSEVKAWAQDRIRRSGK